MGNLGNKAVMAKNIEYFMKLNNKSRSEVCNDIGVSYTTFTDWVKGKTYPRIDKIEKMANYFHVSKSDLVEENSPAISDEGMSNDKKYLIDWIRSAPENEVAKLRLIVDQVIGARGK